MSSYKTSPGQYGTTILDGQHSTHDGHATPQQTEHFASYASNHSTSSSTDLYDYLDPFNSNQDHSQSRTDLSSWSSMLDYPHLTNEPEHATPIDIEENPTEPEPPDLQRRNSLGLFFSSFFEGYSAIPLPDWPFSPYDTSMSQTDEDSQQWILRLLHALNNIEDVGDKMDAASKKNWLDPSTIYSAKDKEELCWQIFKTAEDLHHKGPRVFECFDPIFWSNAVKTRGWTFQQRMETIMKVLRYSKARCTRMFKSKDPIKDLVANPENVLNMTLGNVKQNTARQALLAAGRARNQEQAKADTMNEIKTEPPC